jgi:8-oxo-dGTP diphosphatase
VSSSREYPERPVVDVGAVVVVRPADATALGFVWESAVEHGSRDVGIVLVKRRFEPLAGRWSLPGGAVEAGETLQAAIAREVREETGLVVDVGPVVEILDRIILDSSDRVHYHFVLIDYLCRPLHGRLEAGSDVSEAIVADPASLERYTLTDAAQSVIARALQMLE